ncbi:hypothetical protein NQZ79_g6987 [Umbelopsis isabellina]|nr:hypothetical protein NQZ79_g6987 [Umbelopsis isabellina]
MSTARWLIWSPHEGYNQFLVGGSELKLYEWLPEGAGAPASTQLISSIPIPNITLMMCADWSPDPSCNDLVAVGLTTGRTVLVRMNEHTNIEQSPRAYNTGENLVSPRRGASRAPVPSGSPQISTQQYPMLPVKSSRACNVVKFSSTYPNLLAVGLDKARNESCLMVWDVSQATSLDESRSPGAMTPVHSGDTGMSAQVVNTWKGHGSGTFDANERLNQAAGIYANANSTTKSAKPGEQKLIQQYGSAEAITSCAWLNDTSAPLLIAGMGGKWLRLYDIRQETSSTSLSIQDKAVYGLTTDPFHQYRLASYTDDGVIKIWDTRKANDALLTINADHTSGLRTPLSRIAFAPSKRGLLASLSRDATAVDLWDIQETGPASTVRNSLQRAASPFEMQSNAANGPPTGETDVSSSGFPWANGVADEDISIPLLWRSRRMYAYEAAQSTKALASFSFIPKANRYFQNAHPSVQGLLTMTKDGTFDTMKIQQVPNMTWEPNGGLLTNGGMGMIESKPSVNATSMPSVAVNSAKPPQLDAFGIDQTSTALHKLHISTSEEDRILEQGLRARIKDPSQDIRLTANADPELSAALAQDISVLMRKRVAQGYSMNCRKNLEIAGNDRKLKELWMWMLRSDHLCVGAESFSHGKSQIGNVDYSFQGVLGVWLGPTQNRRSSPSSTPRSSNNSPPPPLSQRVTQRLPSDHSSDYRTSPRGGTPPPSANPSGEDQLYMVKTSRLQQRYLALALCGFAFTAEQLEVELVRLESDGQYDIAAGWALFNGLPDRAIRALSSQRGKALGASDEQQRKLMSAVLAGYQANRNSVNTTWQELCQSLSDDMDGRPYLKAIFAYIASNDWSVILKMKELPLSERMAVALRILEDDELSVYITSTAEDLIQEGDIEGVVVTGLTSKGIDLFERAIDRYGDIQTASVVLSFVMPKRFKDRRVEDWVEVSLLDRWQLWHDRANFDIERGKRMNSSEIAAPQVYVRCNYCAQSLGHSLVVQNVRNRDGKRMSVQANINSGSGGRGAGKQKVQLQLLVQYWMII